MREIARERTIARERESEGGRESEKQTNKNYTHIRLQNVQDSAWNETSHPKPVHV